MATTTDRRVVEMRFDNAQFEENVKTTLSTLDRLKEKLGLIKSTDIDVKANSSGLNGMATALDSINDRFSTMGIVGMTVLQNITNAALNAGKQMAGLVINPIKEGGKRRALNIETAKFQLGGLGVAWEDILPDIDYAVQDTAYGLDSAARAAAQLTASGIKLGDEMKSALRGISGAAAMTNTDYDEMARVFTTVAGNGRVMASELNRIGQRGLNAAAALAKYYGTTEEEIREMVSGGEVDALNFFKAMDQQFGEHAKKANETYTGALANVKSALGRIGAAFYTPYLEHARDVFNALRPAINGVNEALEPFKVAAEAGMKSFKEFAVSVLSNADFARVYKAQIAGAANAMEVFKSFLAPVRKAIENVFPKITLKQIAEFNEKLAESIKKLQLRKEQSKKVEIIFTGAFN